MVSCAVYPSKSGTITSKRSIKRHARVRWHITSKKVHSSQPLPYWLRERGSQPIAKGSRADDSCPHGSVPSLEQFSESDIKFKTLVGRYKNKRIPGIFVLFYRSSVISAQSGQASAGYNIKQRRFDKAMLFQRPRHSMERYVDSEGHKKVAD